jgi:nitrogen fixation protein
MSQYSLLSLVFSKLNLCSYKSYNFFTPLFFLMTVVSYGASTELDAVNSILMSVGESPVNTLSVQSPEVVIAQKTLQQVCREILTEGWKFNTETQYPITLDSNDHCIIPNNVLQIDLNRFRHPDAFDTIRKTDNGVQKLYDLHDHTYAFTNTSGGKIYVDIIWMITFEEIPQTFRDYITVRASRIASNRMVNNPQAAELIAQDEAQARAVALEYDTNQGDYNIFNNQEGRTNASTVYRPYQVLQRR